MDAGPEALNWALLRAFLAVAEAGSLSGAARVLGASQPTLGRQIREIESALGLALFRRHARGLELTEAGAAMLGPVRAMHAAALEVGLYAAGRETGLAGTVRITASEFVAHHLLPETIARIREQAPDIAIELVPSDSTENLLYREADIALRMYRPEQADIVSRQIGEIELGAFAARSYLARRGRPEGMADFLEHDLVGYDRSDLILRGMRAAGLDVSRDMFSTRCDSQTVYWELVRAGCGIGFGQLAVARRDPSIVEIDLGVQIPQLPIWIAAHRDLRHTPRVRKVWEMLAEGLSAAVS